MAQDVGVELCALIFSAEMKWQLAIEETSAGGMLEHTRKRTPCPKRWKRVQWDSRRVQLYYLMIKGSIQEDIAIKNIYTPKIGTPQYEGQKLM